MRLKIYSLMVGVAGLFVASACSNASDDMAVAPENGTAAPKDVPAVKLLLTGGRIHTPDGVVEALAVDDGGVIVALGSAQDLASLEGAGTEVIALNGKAVLPGFHDIHVHPLFGGLSARECRIPQGSSLEELQARVKACVDEAEPGTWVTGGQWDAPAIGGLPHRQMLDGVAPDNPVFLNDTSGHSAWVNTRALEIAEVTRDTADPEGGIIERDRDGAPTGVFRESAVELVRRHVPTPSDAQVRDALGWALETMLSYGITSFTEASVGFAAGLEKEVEAYAALADAGVLKQRAQLCLTWAPGSEDAEEIIRKRNRYARNFVVSTDCVKIFLDGVPTDSHTAAMLEPYVGVVEGRGDDASRTGLLLVDQDVLDDAVTRFDRMGLTVKFHAAGDAAVRAGLDAVAAAREANGYSSQMHNVGHCTFVSQEDMSRARDIGATYEVSPYLWGPTPINDSIIAAVGPARIERVWPVREMIESGALVVPGSDWAVVPSVNPWIGVETLVTREKPGGSEESFGKMEAISLAQAIDMYTVNSARQKGLGHAVGRIDVGMIADLVILDRDPFEIPTTELHRTRVMKTLINGEVVYERQ